MDKGYRVLLAAMLCGFKSRRRSQADNNSGVEAIPFRFRLQKYFEGRWSRVITANDAFALELLFVPPGRSIPVIWIS